MNIIKDVMLISTGMLTRGVSAYFHEWGHAKAAEALFEDADPMIKIDDWIFGVGSCSSWDNSPTLLGSRFSKETRAGIRSAAGPMVDFLNITISLCASWSLRNRCKRLALSLALHALNNSLGTFVYCSSSTHGDYVNIAKNLSVPHSILCTVTLTTTLISGIWFADLAARLLISRKHSLTLLET